MVGWDKLAHIAVGFMLFDMVAKLAAFLTAWPLSVAAATTIAAAAGKEVWDASTDPATGQRRGTPDVWDAVATLAGGVLAYAARG